MDTVYTWTYSSGLVNQTGFVYIDNLEYKIYNGNLQGPYWLRVYNSEGYAEDLTINPYVPFYYYYHKDHLGNNREVWKAAYSINGTVTPAGIVQQTSYYPSGLPWSDGSGVSTQPYKYNGKEFVEIHGYDTYDYGARGYYPASGRFMSVDPLAEKYYSISPYAYCAGNPVNRIDPTGMDWIKNNENGNVEWRPDATKDNVPEGYKYVGDTYMGIRVNTYERPKEYNEKELGIEINISYKGKDGEYEWVQTVDTNAPTDNRIKSPYVDPTPADDDLPYYYTKEENSNHINKNGSKTYFEDKIYKHGDDTYWNAELSLVKRNPKGYEYEFIPNVISPLRHDRVITLSYGFSRKDGITNLSVVSNPSIFHINSINTKVQYPTLVPSQH